MCRIWLSRNDSAAPTVDADHDDGVTGRQPGSLEQRAGLGSGESI
jgi:hypothetical protein